MKQLNQIVYVLSNPAMPGLIKIGMTNRNDIEARLKELYTTGVPVPFSCEYACRVDDASKVEGVLHLAFGDSRVNRNREFFRLSPDKVIAVLGLVAVEELTADLAQEIRSEIDSEDLSSGEKLRRSRRPNMNFKILGIQDGERLYFEKGEKFVVVAGEKKVSLEGEEMSLTQATRVLMNLEAGTPIQPSPYWYYKGESVFEIYQKYYEDVDYEEAA